MYGGGRSDSSTVATRQQAINTAYDRLVQGAELRRKYLEEAIRLFGLIRECDEVEVWIREKVSMVAGTVTMHLCMQNCFKIYPMFDNGSCRGVARGGCSSCTQSVSDYLAEHPLFFWSCCSELASRQVNL